MKRSLTVLSGITALLITGCTSSPEPAPTVTETVAAAPVEAPAAEPVESIQDIQAWSITANEVHTTVEDATTGWDEYGCLPHDITEDSEYPACGATLIAMKYSAETASIQWNGVMREDSPRYIPTRPESVETYIAEGSEKIAALDQAFAVIDSECPEATQCPGHVLRGIMAFESAESFFSNWP